LHLLLGSFEELLVSFRTVTVLKTLLERRNAMARTEGALPEKEEIVVSLKK
jgi:hypothetical protein